ncbi:S-methyl-5-thioribose kinase [Paenibacillus sp. JCM 10914]|uniref:S-methyl-5-thioribose kinase n=1 Tax=Paenibacillus sp. JCM 10914 TaxID=1236974 RepID=UPI0003CC4411|nr:S-methyl-5-thioribose kinase [Paenibacillus sp. JCM 10914]GAE05831.1 5-methylthioribose kinase [Paenibacillus sp. JCM 10914]
MSAYHPLTAEEAIQLAKSLPGRFPDHAELQCREIGDGNLNLVFHVTATNTADSIIIKQAVPYAKVVGESWPLSLDRARIERVALETQHSLCPNLVPKVYSYSDELAYTVMEDLSEYTIMRKGLIEGNAYPEFAAHIGEFMARTLFYTSDLGMNQQEKKVLAGRFVNPDLCKITEDLIFEDPYRQSANNNYPDNIEDEAEALRSDAALHFEVALLRHQFLTHGQALLHGDLHTGSIFVTPESTKVIDPEFAFFGPMGFDVGAVIGNLLLNYAAQPGWSKDAQTLAERESRLLQMAADVWTHFERNFRMFWNDDLLDEMARTPGYQDHYVAQILKDAAGFAGCKMIRRIVGLSHVADIDTIDSDSARENAQRRALAIGKNLVRHHRHIQSFEEILSLVKESSIRNEVSQ